jgi:hypothetical protein
LNHSIKQLKVYFGIYQIKWNPKDLFFPIENVNACFVMIGDLCICFEDGKKSHGNKMGALPRTVEITMLSYYL